LEQLPSSCWESADELEKNRAIYEKDGVFSPALIDGVVKKLRAYNDKNIRLETEQNPAKMKELVELYYHCG
jgi:glutamine synthetase